MTVGLSRCRYMQACRWKSYHLYKGTEAYVRPTMPTTIARRYNAWSLPRRAYDALASRKDFPAAWEAVLLLHRICRLIPACGLVWPPCELNEEEQFAVRTQGRCITSSFVALHASCLAAKMPLAAVASPHCQRSFHNFVTCLAGGLPEDTAAARPWSSLQKYTLLKEQHVATKAGNSDASSCLQELESRVRSCCCCMC